MSIGNDNKTEAVVAFVSGAIIGVALTLLLVRTQKGRVAGWKPSPGDDDYDVELFI